MSTDFSVHGEEAVAQAFIEEYLLTLLARAARILDTLAAGTVAEGIDAIASLRTISVMAGAARLEEHCGDVQRTLREGQQLDVGDV